MYMIYKGEGEKLQITQLTPANFSNFSLNKQKQKKQNWKNKVTLKMLARWLNVYHFDSQTNLSNISFLLFFWYH